MLVLAGSSVGIVLAAAALTLQCLWRRRWASLLRGADGAHVSALLLEQQNRIRALERELAAARSRLDDHDERLRHCLRPPGVVRFNAYADTGADLSFAVALTDARGDGVVISSLFGRDAGRVYAKPLSAGTSDHLLTPEEQEAIAQAWTPSSS